MIKNIVFDFGHVLVEFNGKYIASFYFDNKDLDLAEKVLFDRKFWDALDAGKIPDHEIFKSACDELPEHLRASGMSMYENWFYHLPEINGMRDLITYLRDEYNINIYLLSNISRGFAEHADEIPILSLIDDCVFSSTCGFTKPSSEIFNHLCDKFSIDPSETIFIDDSEKNVLGAENFGIQAYQFDGDSQKLKTYLDNLLKKTTVQDTHSE